MSDGEGEKYLFQKSNAFFLNTKFWIAADLLVEKCKQVLFRFKIALASERVVCCQHLQEHGHKAGSY